MLQPELPMLLYENNSNLNYDRSDSSIQPHCGVRCYTAGRVYEHFDWDFYSTFFSRLVFKLDIQGFIKCSDLNDLFFWVDFVFCFFHNISHVSVTPTLEHIYTIQQVLVCNSRKGESIFLQEWFDINQRDQTWVSVIFKSRVNNSPHISQGGS